jgi:hypothetical protein
MLHAVGNDCLNFVNLLVHAAPCRHKYIFRELRVSWMKPEYRMVQYLLGKVTSPVAEAVHVRSLDVEADAD